MIVYFSGTGNSRYVAEILSEVLGDETMDAGALLCRNETALLSSVRPWIFVCPVYGWRMPRIFSAWIEKGEFSGATDAYFLLTCGSDMGDAGKYLKKLCEKKGFAFCGVQDVVMPENYIAMFKAPGKRLAAKIRKEAVPVVKKAAAQILAGEKLAAKKVDLGGRLKSSVVNPAFYALCVKSKAFYVKENCIGCGKCAKNCPVSGIEMRDGKPHWTGACTHCMACICLCGENAIEYGKKSEKKVRYRCPSYSEEKILHDEA